MVGCCNIGPCKKKRSYEFNNPAYNKSNKAETYRHSQVLTDQENGATANGSAQLQGYAAHPGGDLERDTNPGVGINGVVAVDLDSNSPSVLDGASDTGGKGDFVDSDDKEDHMKKQLDVENLERKDSKRSSKSSHQSGKPESTLAAAEAGSTKSNRESRETESEISGGAVPYPDGSCENQKQTNFTSTYTSVVTHHIGAEGEGDDAISDTSKRISNVSSSIHNYDLKDEGHFHSVHKYTTDVADINNQDDPHIPAEAEALDNLVNDITEDNSNGYTTVTHVTETSVIHINTPANIDTGHQLDSHDQLY